MGVVAGAAPDQGCHVVGQLEGREELAGLAEPRPRGLILAGLVLRQCAGALIDLNARALPQAEGPAVGVEPVQPQGVAHLSEEVVAGDSDGLTDVDAAVPAPGAVVEPAVGVAVGVPGVGPGAGGVDDGGGGDDAALQGRHGGEGLEGGAGGVGAGDGPVHVGVAGILAEKGVVLGVGALAVGGIGGKGQDLAVRHADHRRRRAPVDRLLSVLQVLLVHGLDGPGQNLLHLGLEVDVQGQGHGAPGLGLDGVDFAGDLALLVGGDEAGAVPAPEVLLKGQLHPVLAHLIVQAVVGEAGGVLPRLPGGVPLRVEAVPLLPGLELPHPAQDVGGVVGVVLAHGLAADDHALKGPVVEDGDELHGQVLREDVGHGHRVGCQLAQAQLVEHAQHQPGLLAGEVGGHAEVGPHELQEVGGGEGRGAGELQLVQQGLAHEGGGGGRGQLGAGPLPVRQIVGEPGPLGPGGVSEGVAVGLGIVDGQAVAPGYAVVLEEGENAQKGPGHGGLVGLAVLVRDEVRVKGDGVDLPVGDEDLAVAVHDDAPGGLHGLGGGDLDGGAGQILAAVDDLGVVEDACKQGEAENIRTDQEVCPPVEAFFVGHSRVLLRFVVFFLLLFLGRKSNQKEL